MKKSQIEEYEKCILQCLHNHSLDFKWSLRLFLSQNLKQIRKIMTEKEKESDNFSSLQQGLQLLLYYAVSPFHYIRNNRDLIDKDRSLTAICQLCTHSDLIYDVDHTDQKLKCVANLVNQLIESDRTLIMCYDCGTVARGVFWALIREYRGQFILRPTELTRIRNEYYMSKYSTKIALNILSERIHQTKQNCIFLCALQIGNAGHIYVIEKYYFAQKPVYRLYQSNHQSYLLIDHLEYMNYAQYPAIGINIDQHLHDLRHLLTTKQWQPHDYQLFAYWYWFYPRDAITTKTITRLASTYIVY